MSPRVESYRAVLVDPGKPAPDRPIQIITNSLADVEDWAVTVLSGRDELPGPSKIQVSDQAEVVVYQSVESQFKIYDRTMARHIRHEKQEKKLHLVQEPEL